MKEFILDTSVIIKWFSEYDENDLEKALHLREEILDGSLSIVVPEFLFLELANALRYNKRFNERDVKDAVNSVYIMGFDVKALEISTMACAVEMAFNYNVAVYDAYFLALSHIENKAFITADYKFANRMKGCKGIVKLSELSQWKHTLKNTDPERA